MEKFIWMKRVCLTLLLALSATGLMEAQANSIEGAWTLVSYDYGNGLKTMTSPSKIKIISGNHFMWVHIDSTRLKTAESGIGTFTLNGDRYVEHVDFIDGGQGMIGKDQIFTIQVQGDTLTQSGTVTTGRKGLDIKETWKRMR